MPPYAERCLDPREWQALAEALREAASPLREDVRRLLSAFAAGDTSESTLATYKEVHVYYMLWAYSLENLLKAAVVSKRRAEWDRGRVMAELPEVLRTHDLLKLCEEAGLNELAKEYEDILSKLSECSVWFGRYPIPTTAKRFESPPKFSYTGFASNHVDDLEKLYQEISGAIAD